MGLYISTPDLLKRYGISKGTLINWRNKQDFPEPVIKAHGRSSSRYGIKAVASWEERNGLLESLDIQPLMSNRS
ncbi:MULTISPECIES: helix-turn-helix transcriptional regulator [unclassified Acinetobacter]|uniref:helix-turn-helix transcriptional regulator n=1 Tax=unclassified Acinetobacter TaxID=196816 RepID=UPI0037700C65